MANQCQLLTGRSDRWELNLAAVSSPRNANQMYARVVKMSVKMTPNVFLLYTPKLAIHVVVERKRPIGMDVVVK